MVLLVLCPVPAVGEYVGQLERDELGTKSSDVGDVEKLEVFKAAQCACTDEH